MKIEPGQIWEVTGPLGLINPNTKILILNVFSVGSYWTTGNIEAYQVWIEGKTEVVNET